MEIGDICRIASSASTIYEEQNSELKRKYLLLNIMKFWNITTKMEEFEGLFGTGYPFYALDPLLKGNLPIINEQIDYNNKLLDIAKKYDKQIWSCKKCLEENYSKMADLKEKCKPCEKINDGLKPRKIINRLPDIDLWMVCNDGEIENASKKLALLLRNDNLEPSDINPIDTIFNVSKIATELKDKKIPNRMLPMDVHLIEKSELIGLINKLPKVMKDYKKTGCLPFVPIHPLSYRKKWQKDDEPYNFVLDFIYSMKLITCNKDIKEAVKNSRKEIVENFTCDELYNILELVGGEATKRRLKTETLAKLFYNKMNLWKKKYINKNKGERSYDKD